MPLFAASVQRKFTGLWKHHKWTREIVLSDDKESTSRRLIPTQHTISNRDSSKALTLPPRISCIITKQVADSGHINEVLRTRTSFDASLSDLWHALVLYYCMVQQLRQQWSILVGQLSGICQINEPSLASAMLIVCPPLLAHQHLS